MESTMKCVRECKEDACFQICGARCTARRTTKKEPANKLRIKVSQRDQCQHDRKEKPTRRLRRKTQRVEQEPTQKLRLDLAKTMDELDKKKEVLSFPRKHLRYAHRLLVSREA